MTNLQMTNDKTNKIGFDLEERTSKFGVGVIKFLKKPKRDIYNEPIIRQLIRSATSIGANYREANRASLRWSNLADCSACFI